MKLHCNRFVAIFNLKENVIETVKLFLEIIQIYNFMKRSNPRSYCFPTRNILHFVE